MNLNYTIILCLFTLILNAQNSWVQQSKDIQSINYSTDLQTPSQIVLSENSTLKKLKGKALIAKLFEVSIEELHFKNETNIGNNISIEKYTRSIDNIRVPHGSYSVLKKDNQIESVHAEHYDKYNVNKSNYLSEKSALELILPKLGSELYAWESTKLLLDKYDKTSIQYRKLKEVLAHEYPTGELVYVKDYYSDVSGLHLAYLFTIESVVPEFRDRIYVSVSDGRILLRDAQLKHGVGDTRYSGTRTFPTTEITGPGALYELKGIDSLSGILCETRSLEGLGGVPVSTPAIVALSDSIADGDEPDPCLIDSTVTIAEFGDDVWNSNEHRKVVFNGGTQSCCQIYTSGDCDEVNNDDIALDAQWGASMVARYFKDIHDRNGYDNEGADIYSYVHHGLSYENASWNGMIMKYGDGAFQDGNNPAAMVGPLTSLDVCAHEIGHAVCTSTSDLVYVGESGAMNEGLSDIWGASLESYVLDSIDTSLVYIIWGIGEQIDERDGGLYNDTLARALRWMDHPPAESNPDTYGAGTWWQDPDCASPNIANDFCGVHFNSGVLNKWFYLLTVGSGKALSPGLNKPKFDDQINDKNHIYSVNGIGINKSEKIVYGANLLLQPNSKFVDMRAASIDIARSLFGPCSNEVKQTIRAWYAVGVGPDFSNCLPTIEFNQFNPYLVSETSTEVGCLASKEINLSIYSYMAMDSIYFTTQGNAIEGEDYELCVNSLYFNGDEEKQLKITIFDDKVVEGSDTIIINFAGGGYSDSDTLIIINDDGTPAIGGVDTLFHETFDVNDNSWQQELVNPISLLNEWYIDAFNTNQAHISYQPSTNLPSYAQVVESHVRIKSPLIDGIGRRNINVNFNYQVGGERDLVDPDALFDYGTFEVSYDGFDWEAIDNFVGIPEAGGIVQDSGLYQIMLPQLDNSAFYLGYTWYNDALNGTAYSFMFDNVVVTGEGLDIESDVNDFMEAKVPAGEEIAFISVNDTEVIAVLDNSKDDLGCTSISIGENDELEDTKPSKCLFRSSKTYKISTENVSDSILVTIFYKESEIDGWDDYSSLNILAVKNLNIENETSGYTIIDNSQIVIDDQSDGGNGYVKYTFWMSSSFQSLALTNRPVNPQVLWVENSTDSDSLSLRDIVSKACSGDTIKFAAAVDGNTIALTTGMIEIDKVLHIEGNGLSNSIVNNNFDTAISILPTGNVSLRNIKISSNASSPSILNSGTIIVKESVLIGQ